DLIIPEPDGSQRSIQAFTEFTGDPLQIIVWPNDVRRYSLGTDVIGVYVCTWPGATFSVDLTAAAATLNAEVTSFYEGLSGGAYSPQFISRKTLAVPDDQSVWSDCETAMADEAALHPLWGDSGAIGILEIESDGGLATPGPSFYNIENILPERTKFPGNGRWAIVEGQALEATSIYDAHITTAVHEIGHTINFPHSYSGEVLYDVYGNPYLDEYDNPIDYMSGNMPAGLIGRRIAYPYSTLAFNRYRAGWVDTSDVVFYAGGVVEVTLAPVGVDGTQMVIVPTDYQYSLVTLDARTNSAYDPVPPNFEGISAHYVEQWWRDPATDQIEAVGGAASRVYTYPPSPDSLDHLIRVGEERLLDVHQGEDLLAQGTLLKVLGETADGFQIKLIGFDDIADSVFIGDILWLAESGITKGCSDTSFCPTQYVTRGQMAAFLSRALGYTNSGDGDLFTDDDGSIFEVSIDRLATAGVTKGCNPPINDNFCPDNYVTREQMAAFLVRALNLIDQDPQIDFDDDDTSIFEDAIEKLATAGITKGCNPPTNSNFCPHDRVTRQQMAAFLNRALG
ncbi:MAG: S-layer homology domain-containing protein, partial [bacterium]|nr:S-layer homology domain-containing protein [bacterium]